MARSSSFKNMVIVLTLVALTASAVLGGMYILTKEPIEIAEIAKINMAIADVVPAFDNNPSEKPDTVTIDGRNLYLFYATKDNELVGVAITTVTTKGFGGLMTLMVGFLPDGTINNTAVISHSETPGLGDKIIKSKGDKIQLWKYIFPNWGDDDKKDFAVQFDRQNPETFKLAVKKDGGDVDAITAATISSRAFCDAVERAYKAFQSVDFNKYNKSEN